LTRRLSVHARLALRMLRRLDPRLVRLTNPRRHPDRRLLAVLLIGGLSIGGAAAIAATREGDVQDGNYAEYEVQTAPDKKEEPEPSPLRRGPRKPFGDAEVSLFPLEERHPRFHDPIYVFTDEPARAASAYPLADPPGVVVDIEGSPEPDSEAMAMVGKDDRIKLVRRRMTATGIRYIIRLSTPVTKIETEHEGNVVIVSPLR
jgi:hypothetical protein